MGSQASKSIERHNTAKKTSTTGAASETSTAAAANNLSSESSDTHSDPTIKLITSLADVDLTREYHGVENGEYVLPADA
ncbi:hypothetical protein HK100_011370, partial [Physocladia obscura]